MPEHNITDELNDLLIICNDGKDFYEYAVLNVKDYGLKSLFEEMVRIREQVVADLTEQVVMRGGEPAGDEHSLAGSTRQLYAKLKKALSSDGDRALIGELEEAEDRTLEAFREAAASPPTPEVGVLIQKHLSIFENTHNRMRALKKAA